MAKITKRERKQLFKMVYDAIYRDMSDARIAAVGAYDDLHSKIERIEGAAYAAAAAILDGIYGSK